MTLPAWLDPLLDTLDTVRPEDLAPRFPHPPDDARPAAVLILFSDGPEGPDLLLTERAATLRSHAGQISFPGGRTDPDDAGPVQTALREAQEEVGLDPSGVEVIGELPSLWLPPSHHAVTPVLAYWHTPEPLGIASPAEVARVLHYPLDRLIDPARRFTVVGPTGWRGPAFDVGTSVPLWGFTAGIVARLFEKVGWEKPWDVTVERDIAELL